MENYDPKKLQRLATLFDEEYERLYNARTPIPGFQEAVDKGDKFMRKNHELMSRLTEIRGDCIASDREVAALWFALKRDRQDIKSAKGQTRLVAQECQCCGKRFMLRYHSNGSYDYVGETCDCEADFSPIDGEPSLSQWLENLK